MININNINKILQQGGAPLYPEHLELPNELTIKIFEYLNIQQLLLLLNDDDTKLGAISAIKTKLLHSKLNINDLVLLYNHTLFKKIIIFFILKELNKTNVSLLFIQDVYINIKNKGLINKIKVIIDNLYYSMFAGEPPIINDLIYNNIVNAYLIKLSYIRIYKTISGFFEKYPNGIRGGNFIEINQGISYKFTIEFKKPENSKIYIIEPSISNGDCYISTPIYIWQILEDCTNIMLYNKLVELINNSFEYSYLLNTIELIKVTHMPDVPLINESISLY